MSCEVLCATFNIRLLHSRPGEDGPSKGKIERFWRAPGPLLLYVAQDSTPPSTYAQAKATLRRLECELRLLNVSAAKSLADGLEETLTLHRLGLFAELGPSFKTTNALESIMAQLEQRTAKVDHWRTSEQKQRWCAAALLALEPRLRKVKAYRHLPRLAEALRAATRQERDAA